MKGRGSEEDGRDVNVCSKKRQKLTIKWMGGAKAGRRDK